MNVADPLASLRAPPATEVVVDYGTGLSGFNVYRVYLESPVLTEWEHENVREFGQDRDAAINAAIRLAYDLEAAMIDRLPDLPR